MAPSELFLQRFRETISDQPRPDIGLETTLESLDDVLDSLAFVMLISMLDEQYGVNVDGSQIRNCHDVAAVWALAASDRSAE